MSIVTSGIPHYDPRSWACVSKVNILWKMLLSKWHEVRNCSHHWTLLKMCSMVLCYKSVCLETCLPDVLYSQRFILTLVWTATFRNHHSWWVSVLCGNPEISLRVSTLKFYWCIMSNIYSTSSEIYIQTLESTIQLIYCNWTKGACVHLCSMKIACTGFFHSTEHSCFRWHCLKLRHRKCTGLSVTVTRKLDILLEYLLYSSMHILYSG